MPEPCHPAEFFIFVFFFFCRMVKKTNKQQSCGRRGAGAWALGCSLVLPLAQGAHSYEHPVSFRGGPCASRVFPRGFWLPEVTESFLL